MNKEVSSIFIIFMWSFCKIFEASFSPITTTVTDTGIYNCCKICSVVAIEC